MAHNEPEVAVDQFWTDGFLQIRNVFTSEEIANYRNAILSAGLDNVTGDLLSYPDLRSMVVNERLLNAVRKILDTEQLQYFGDSNVTVGSRGYHKDNVDRTDPNGPDWTQGRYTVVRVGIYLQDHSENSGGLNVRRGSHNAVQDGDYENVYLRSRIGDVVVWCLRTSHSGNGYMRRFNMDKAVPPDWLDLNRYQGKTRLKYKLKRTAGRQLIHLRRLMIKPPQEARLGCFISYGTGDAHQQRFIECLKTRQYAIDRWAAQNYDDSVWQAAEDANLTLIDMKTENMLHPAPEIFAEHTALPY